MLPMLICLVSAAPAWCQESSPPESFDVASIRPTEPSYNGWKLEFNLDGLTGRGVTLQMMVEEAYEMYDEDRIQGLPAWGKSERFDVEAKQGSADGTALRALTLNGRRAMLKALLAERFALHAHEETREADVFVLTIAKHGARLHQAEVDDAVHSQMKGFHCLFSGRGKDFLVAQTCTPADLASTLRSDVGRTVKDETGLHGSYDFSLRWSSPSEGDATGASIFTALEEQLGLKLVPAKRPVEFVVVDHAEEPSAN
jgi:uncharacterized protein (TIGR03435 family)